MEENKLSALVDNIISIKPMFYKTLGKPIPQSIDITPGEYYAMLYLKKHESLTMSDLGKILYISKPNVTVLVNKLILKDFVIRLSDIQDRRIIIIKLTDKGSLFVEKHNTIYMDHLKKKLLSLSDKELELFSVSLQNVKDLLSKITITNCNEFLN